jgi:NAD(P)-dependent dehydrogenase (short-subunit alcohol dehydrogenase family)
MQTLSFENKVVFISGAGGGIGWLAAAEFARAGARLALVDIDEDAVNSVAEQLVADGCEVLAECCDVTNEESVVGVVQSATARFDRLDIAVNNAGVLQDPGRLADTESSEWQRNLDINAGGVFNCMKHQLALMKTQSAGVILNMSSAAGVIGAPYMAAYAAAKHAVVGLTRTAALEYARYGIRVNALCPSYVDSPMVDAFTGNADEQRAKLCRAIPMRRLATMEEVVHAMLWLCSDFNTYMTGQTISLDGGLTAG